MTIRKQIILLASFIIMIPLFCLAFILIHNYTKSEQRFIINDYKEIRKYNTEELSPEEWDELKQTIKLLPPNVQTLVISNDDKIIFSSIPEYEFSSSLTKHETWEFINNTSNQYFYQFTSVKINNKFYTFISRMSREKQPLKRGQIIFFQFQVFIFCIICICILILILIAKSIFKSITFLQEKTELIANGDLSAKIEINKNQSANEITSISENLEKMRLSLLEAQNRKNRFIMGISHDLRTPVAIIKGYTEALSDGIITETQEIKQSLQLINSKTSQLEEMIDTLINYTKLNSSKIRDKMKIQSITDFFTSFIKEISIMGSLYNRKIITNNNLNEQIQLLFDEQLINRALENLFSNAIRYTNNNDTITVNLYKQDNSIFFEMIDTGCGMTKDEINNIFDLFYRGTNSRLEKGMGIGLSVVKNIISSHEWNIDVESEKNKGSKFTIIIPLKTNN